MDFPPDFTRQMADLIGAGGCRALEAALNGPPEVSVRLNEAKLALFPGALRPVRAERVPWCRTGYYLESRPRFTFDPLLHAGLYYVEEPSSMFVEQAFLKAQGERPMRRVLDLCAAPGGKATLLRGLMGEGCLLVANDPVARRAAALAENLVKWGDPDVAVTCSPPSAFGRMKGFFDLILADVPCSGEGMFRKDAKAREEWSAEAVEACAARQRGIVSAAWDALRDGGFLVYCTCTFNRRENEDNVRWIASSLGAETVPVGAGSGWGVAGGVAGCGGEVSRFFPHLARGEGFFLALLRKKSGGGGSSACPAPGGGKDGRPAYGADLSRWLRGGGFRFFNSDGAVCAVREGLAGSLALLRRHVNVICAGIPMTRAKQGSENAPKGRRTVPTPAHGLALSTELARGVFEEAEADYAGAIRYLRGESLPAPPLSRRGHTLVTYRGVSLGFANNTGSRLNNACPQAWRIRSTYAPPAPPDLGL